MLMSHIVLVHTDNKLLFLQVSKTWDQILTTLSFERLVFIINTWTRMLVTWKSTVNDRFHAGDHYQYYYVLFTACKKWDFLDHNIKASSWMYYAAGNLKIYFMRPFTSLGRIRTDQRLFGDRSYSCEDFVLFLLFTFLFSLVFSKSDKNNEEPSSNITSGWLCRLFHTWKLKIFLSDWNAENNFKINSKHIMPFYIR